MTLMLCFFSLLSCLSETSSSAGSTFVVWLTTALFVHTRDYLAVFYSSCRILLVRPFMIFLATTGSTYVPASSPRLRYSPAPRRESATTSMAVQWGRPWRKYSLTLD
jgi:hypothetical protein